MEPQHETDDQLSQNIRTLWISVKADSLGEFKSLFLEVDNRGYLKLFRRIQVKNQNSKSCSTIAAVKLKHWKELHPDIRREVL
jgi:hypothetical protein